MGRTSDARQRLIEAMSQLIWLGSYGSTSVDQICERAEVKKGSFYHFFSSKTELALAVVTEASREVFSTLDHIYSPTVAPLERIRNEARWGYQYQKEIREKFGRVLGCPLFSLGAEIGTREESLAIKIKEILDKHLRYYESALLDAQHQQVIASVSLIKALGGGWNQKMPTVVLRLKSDKDSQTEKATAPKKSFLKRLFGKN